jgi:hypothetical protein
MYWRFLVVLATAIVAWWLSGYDTNLTAEDEAADRMRRIRRCGITVLLAGVGSLGGVLFIFTVVTMAIIWAGCLSELFAGGFHRLIDGSEHCHFDPRKLKQELDQLAALAKQGRNEEALQLCAELMQSGGVSPVALEAMRFRLYEDMFADERLLSLPPLAEAQQLCGKNQYLEAEARLKLLLNREPQNLPAAICLMRLYARTLKRPDKAYGWLRALEQQPGLPPGFIDYVRLRLDDWLAPSSPEAEGEGIEALLVRKA